MTELSPTATKTTRPSQSQAAQPTCPELMHTLSCSKPIETRVCVPLLP